MPKTIGPFRHVDVVSQHGANGFEPVRDRRGTVSPAPVPVLDDTPVARASRDGGTKGNRIVVTVRAGRVAVSQVRA